MVCISFDVLASLNGLSAITSYHTALDCMMGLITACFSSCVLALFIVAYVSLVKSINKIRSALLEVSQ